MSKDTGWPNWYALADCVNRQCKAGRPDEARRVIRVFLRRRLKPVFRSLALGLLGGVEEGLNLPLDAKRYYKQARSIVKAGYYRYTLELSLGRLCKSLAEMEESIAWYRQAIQTSVLVKDTSGGSALSSYLGLRGEAHLTRGERKLCEQAVRRSWEVLGLPGEPEVKNLRSATRKIISGQSNPPKLLRYRRRSRRARA